MSRLLTILASAANPTLGAASVAALNTTVTNDLSPDGFNWAAQQGGLVEDQYGKLIVYAQRYNANTRQCFFVWSNDGGTTWADNTGISGGEGFLVRGSIVYDTSRDCLHSLLCTTNPSDGGIIYRRYTITRDGSNNITSIARVAGVSVVLDGAGGSDSNGLEFPTILMPTTNMVVAAWPIRTVAPGGEIRACRCDLTSDADAGGTAANWVHLGTSSTTTIGAAPAVGSYTIIFSQATQNAIPYFAVKKLANNNLMWVYHTGPTPGSWAYKRSVWGTTSWTSLSGATTITNVQRAGTDTGYALKNQLVSQITEDSTGNVYVGLANWKSNALGDTWTAYKITSADVVSSVDIYSSGGAHSYAPTGDVAYDSVSGRVIVTYEQTTTQDGYIGLLTPALATAQAFAVFESGTNIDIPLIWRTRYNGKVLLGWRVAGTPPQTGRKAFVSWS